MRVIMVNNFFSGYLGGVERYIASLSKELVSLGVEVSICTRGPDTETKVDGLKVHSVSSLAGLRAVIERGGDVVHAHLPRKLFPVEGLRAGRSRGMRTVFTPHAFYPGGGPLKKIAKAAIDLTLTRYTMGLCDAVVNLTPKDQGDAIEKGLDRQRSHIIPNSISASEMSELEEKFANRTLSIDNPYLLHVGRFDPVKNIKFLVRAHRQVEDFDLVLIGQDDGDLAGVKKLIQELGLASKVHIIERADRPTLIAAYAHAAAVVLSSYWEGLPTVLLEGLYFRRPFVASNVGGNGWLAERGASGVLFPVDDEAGYLEALQRSLSFSEGARQRSHDLVLSEFSWETNARKLTEIYVAG